MTTSTEKYSTFIGLEIHIQLLTETKAFCGCPVHFGSEPNTNICPVCMGYPGVLPALNEKALFMAYQVAVALNCTLSPAALFDRKNYFYPDMPKNYQISQFHSPIGREGFIDFPFRGDVRRIRIHDVHLEEDAGKMIHAGDISLIDYNRAGTPLLEIVTEPDLTGGDETEAFIQYFRRFVRYLGVCDGNMEEGSLRCDANISIHNPGAGLGTKVEVKNLNSSRFVRLALDYEKERQAKLLDEGSRVQQETRLWNENRDLTVLMRKKEESHDYRYFPEPDLPPFRPDGDYLESVKSSLPELPLRRLQRFVEDYPLEEEQAAFLIDEMERADFFEETVKHGAGPVEVYRWLSGDVMRHLNRGHLGLRDSALSPKRLADILKMIDRERIHGKIAKKLLQAVFEEDRNPEEILRDRRMEQITDEKEILAFVRRVIQEDPAAAAQAAEGHEKVFGYFMGLVMKLSSGRADPKITRRILEAEIKDSRKKE
jgi:aspartyl-tRNA(Asn)/glutamyl-tRNA(Gln) amidotransferase subunit B